MTTDADRARELGGEPIAELLDRLGPPPEEVVADWIAEAASHRVALAPNLDDPCWANVLVGDDGRLVLPPLVSTVAGSSSTTPPPSEIPARDARTKRRIWIAAAAGSVSLLGAGGWWLSRPDKQPLAATAPFAKPSATAASPSSVDPFSPGHIEPAPRPSASTPARRPEPKPSMSPLATQFSLDAMLPPLPPVASEIELGDDPTETMASDSEKPTSQVDDEPIADTSAGTIMESTATPSNVADLDAADLMAQPESDRPIAEDAVGQLTTSAASVVPRSVFVTLPPLPRRTPATVDGEGSAASADSTYEVMIPWPADATPSLAFPDTVPLELRDDESESDPIAAWRIVDTKSSSVIATLQRTDDGLRLRWSDAAATLSAARSLHHGRLVAPEAMVTLRPMLIADPTPLDFAERDLKLKWSLGGAILPNRSRCNLDVRLPKEVDIGWIEPLESTSPNRMRGVAVISSKDDETVALAVRIDAQTDFNFSLRIRTAARISPDMPWQWTDRPAITESLVRLNERILAIESQNASLTIAIENAKRMGARRSELTMRQQSETVEQALTQTRWIAERVANLDQLIARLASEARIDVDLTVDWPDQPQTLLSTLVAASE